MGFSLSEEQLEKRAREYEDRLFDLSGIPRKYFGKYWTTIDVDDEEFRVRTITIGDGKDFSLKSDRKPTLLLAHG